jgi:hypothetical protein
MTAESALPERRYQFQGSVLAVASADRAVGSAVGYRLRDCPAPTTTAADLRLEFLLHPEPDHLLSLTHGERRAVYDTPVGHVYYRPSEDTLDAVLGSVHMRGRVGRGLATICSRRYEPDARYLAAHPLTMILLCEMLKRRGRYSLHAACVANGGRGGLIAGPSGTGKSTLVLALAARGLDFLSDDMVFLGRGESGIEAHGFSDAIGVTRDTAARFAELSDLAAIAPPAGFRKHLVRIEERFAVRTVARCQPEVLIFPELAPDHESRLESMERDEAWLRLVPDVLLTHPAATQAHLASIAELTEQVACYRLHSGPDVRRSAELIEALLK